MKKAKSPVKNTLPPAQLSRVPNYTLWGALSVCAVIAVLWFFTGEGWFSANTYNSYALQAKAWLSERLDIGGTGLYFKHLEIAEYMGKYYVSFPPFPSLVLLPFVFLFGIQAPGSASAALTFDHMLAAASSVLAFVYAMKLAREYGKTDLSAMLWALFLTVGGNFILVMASGWVWFIAQTFAFSLTLAALYYAKKPCFSGRNAKTPPVRARFSRPKKAPAFDRRRSAALPLFLICAAVLCRPFNIVALPFVVWLLYKSGRLPDFKDAKGILKTLLPAALLVLAALWLNFARFGNPLEFGHNYLPEFLEAEKGQFSLSYIPKNFFNLIRLPSVGREGRLDFPIFDGMCIFLACPVYLSYLILFIKKAVKKQAAKTDFAICSALLIWLLFFTAHKTMGGWQFGNRYTADCLPLLFAGLMRLTENGEKAFLPHIPLFLFGFALNLTGSIALINGWLI